MALVVVIGASVLTAVASQGTDVIGPRLHDLESFVLPNGLKVVIAPQSKAASVAVVASYRVGPLDDPPGRSGLAHLLEHLAIAGPDGVIPGPHIQEVENAGGTFGDVVWNEHTDFSNTVPPQYLERVLWLESQRMNPFTKSVQGSRLERVRQGVRLERARMDSRPFTEISETLRHAVYPSGHPLRAFTIGTMEEVSRVPAPEVLDFWRRAYSPANAYLSIVGAVESRRARQLVERYFGNIQRERAITRRDAPLIALKGEQRIVRHSRMETPTLLAFWRAVAAPHEDGPALRVLASLLTKDHITITNYGEGRAADLTLEARAQPGSTIEDLEEEITSRISTLSVEGPSERELHAAIESVMRTVVDDQRRPDRLGMQLSTAWMLFGNPGRAAETLDDLRKVKGTDIRRVARYLGPNRVIVIGTAQESLPVPALSPRTRNPDNPMLGLWRGSVTDRGRTFGVEVLLNRLVVGETAGRMRQFDGFDCGGTLFLMEESVNGVFALAQTIDQGRNCFGGQVDLRLLEGERLEYQWRPALSGPNAPPEPPPALFERQRPVP